MIRPVSKNSSNAQLPSKTMRWLQLPWRRLARSGLLLGAVFALGIGLASGLFWLSSQNDLGSVLPAQTTNDLNQRVSITSQAPVRPRIMVNELFSYQVLIRAAAVNDVRYEVQTDRGQVSGLQINDEGYLWWQPTSDQAGSYTITISAYLGSSIASQSFTTEVVPAGQPQGRKTDQLAVVNYQLGNKEKVTLQLPLLSGALAALEDEGMTVSIQKARLFISVPVYLYESEATGTWDPIPGTVDKTLVHANKSPLVRVKQLEDKEVTVYLYSDKKQYSTPACPQSCFAPFIQTATSGYFVQASLSVPKGATPEEQKAILELADKLIALVSVIKTPVL